MTTFIDTNKCERIKLDDMQGEMAEVANKALCGAENFTATLRWLEDGEHFEAKGLSDTHQLLYLVEGSGIISLNDKNYDVSKGSGVYLEPSETASIEHAGNSVTKLFHLVVPKQKN